MKLFKLSLLLMVIAVSSTINAQTTKSLVDAGFKLEKDRDFTGAIEKYTAAITLNDENKYHLEALYFRGNCYRSKGDYSKARTDYDAAVKLSEKVPNQNPRFIADLHFNRAMLRIQGYNYEGAIKDFDVVIKNSPKDALAYAYRARCKYDIDDKVGACNDFSKAKSLEPGIISDKFEKAYKKSSKKCD